MCLLAVLFRVRPEAPLVVAANRDELLARPALPTTVLQEQGPRILGGRDLLAGGTWLAINEHGVFAGLTNRPTLARDPSKRSRGELPFALAQHASARVAATSFSLAPRDFSPAWLFVGDRNELFFVDMTATAGHEERARIVELPPGVHILENRVYGVRSAKVQRVTASLHAIDAIESVRDDALVSSLVDVLRDHVVPAGAADDDSGVEGFARPKETEAACVHAGPYGTRSACVIIVPRDVDERPRVWSSDGPPCTHDVVDRSPSWT